jgi:hypothetical protein
MVSCNSHTCSAPTMSATEHLLLFGKIGKPDDVVSVRFDEVAGTLTPLDSVKVGLSPDYIERHP